VGPALEQLYASGYISSEETTVALLTGSGLKATDKIIHYRDEFSSL
jgi:threonine synthase